ncbi:hypothetical protein PBY51_015741 [Eleginops maclovinus]|uniref:Uncharacterized protein n=1 Tax=Eleginops maclovinus TaxID=56733 RepID=A0AAN7XPH6_ELEMC|nr:hypothetical protein PBY51_015741 [Eleginops maclovinus]
MAEIRTQRPPNHQTSQPPTGCYGNLGMRRHPEKHLGCVSPRRRATGERLCLFPLSYSNLRLPTPPEGSSDALGHTSQ